MIIDSSPTLVKYRQTLLECMRLYLPEVPSQDIYNAIDYSINKRMTNSNAYITNSYKRTKKTIIDEKGNQVQTYVDAKQAITLQQLSDYIISREPIVTAFGTMFKHHGEVPNPLVEVVFQFLSNRSKHKNLMFTFPKGSEDFEKYNLLQSLTIYFASINLGTPNGDIGVQTA